jgi:hypothetical protein
LIITKVIGGILQQSFQNTAAEARQTGDTEQEAANERAHQITRDVEGIIATTILAYDKKLAEERKRNPPKDRDHY